MEPSRVSAVGSQENRLDPTGLPVTAVVSELFAGYRVDGPFDEMLDPRSQPRRAYRRLYRELLKLTPDDLWRSKQQSDLSFFNQGITFAVYGKTEGT